MDTSWSSVREGEPDATPPWVQHSRLQAQQELCAKRFLRFASLHQVHGALLIWSAALWFSGINPALAGAPVGYFTGLLAVGRRFLPTCSLENLSLFILVLNIVNFLHLSIVCVIQGDRILSSPMFAFVPLSRVLFGIFTQEVHCHLGLSTVLSGLAISCNSKLVVGGEAFLIIVALLLLELTVVIVLAEGPCGYEEAIMHLAQCRAQHHLIRSQAIQRIDVEREEFSGQLLAVATEGIAELTSAVQRASEPVLNMLKSSCATGTKSEHEADRIGRIGEALKEEVADILRYKTQVAWTRLQERAKARSNQLHESAAAQQAVSDAILRSLQQHMGRSLAQMHELELEAEPSLELVIQGEINRAMETADARMDLVRQSAQAMERRVSDTVEVLLSLLKYFRSKGGSHVVAATRPNSVPRVSLRAAAQSSHECSKKRTTHRKEPDGRRVQVQSRMLPAIQERALLADQLPANIGDENEVQVPAAQPKLKSQDFDDPHAANDFQEQTGTGTLLQRPDKSKDAHDIPCPLSRGSECAGSMDDLSGGSAEDREASGSTSCGPAAERVSSGVNDGYTYTEGVVSSEASESTSDDIQSEASVSSAWTLEQQPTPSSATPAPTQHEARRGVSMSRSVLERHPLFAARLCYRSEEFFWGWASSRDFRAEADSLRQWQRVAAMRHNSEPDSGGRRIAARSSSESSGGDRAASASAMPCSYSDRISPLKIFVDLSSVDIHRQRFDSACIAEERSDSSDTIDAEGKKNGEERSEARSRQRMYRDERFKK